MSTGGKLEAYDYAESTAPAADGSGGTFKVDLAHNGSYDTRVLSAYHLRVISIQTEILTRLRFPYSFESWYA
eukprot:COSAG01_NODE_38645_length_487_cov_0.510309_1_plen_72_part_00